MMPVRSMAFLLTADMDNLLVEFHGRAQSNLIGTNCSAVGSIEPFLTDGNVCASSPCPIA